MEFVIGNPTKIERQQARKTTYVGTLQDGKVKGVTVPKLVNLTDNRHIWLSGTLAIPQIWRFQRISTKFGTITAKGFWVLLLGTPYRGRAIQRGFVTCSSKTIAASLGSRNLNRLRVFAGLKDLLGERPLVLDREFSYLELLLDLAAEGVNFVVHLNLGSQPPKFWDADGKAVVLTVSSGEMVIHQRVGVVQGKSLRRPDWRVGQKLV